MGTRNRHCTVMLAVAYSKCVLTQHCQICQLVHGITHISSSNSLSACYKCSLSANSSTHLPAQICSLFISATVCPRPLVNTFLGASIAQLLAACQVFYQCISLPTKITSLLISASARTNTCQFMHY